MKVTKIFTHGLLWVIIGKLVIPPGIMAQNPEKTVQLTKFTKEELKQMLEPIAL